MADNPTTPTKLDRFQDIFRSWDVREADISPDFDEKRPFRCLIADVWLVQAELEHLERKAKENGGFINGIKPEEG